jgi:hypothetical protein
VKGDEAIQSRGAFLDQFATLAMTRPNLYGKPY